MRVGMDIFVPRLTQYISNQSKKHPHASVCSIHQLCLVESGAELRCDPPSYQFNGRQQGGEGCMGQSIIFVLLI